MMLLSLKNFICKVSFTGVHCTTVQDFQSQVVCGDLGFELVSDVFGLMKLIKLKFRLPDLFFH